MPTYEIKGPDGKTYEIDGPKGATREQVISAIQAKLSAEPKLEPKTRNVFAVMNDTVISIANAAAGGAKAAADFVAPGNSFSKAVDKFIKEGEKSQSDMVKAGREEFQRNLQSAKTAGEEVAAVAKYVAESPLQAAGQAAGSFAGPGLIIKGTQKAAQLLNLTEKTAGRLGLGAGIVTNAAMAGGDAGGSAYELVMSTPDEILLENNFIRSQVEKGIPLEKVKEDAARTAARRASFVPALVGGATGAFGVERFLAGVGGSKLAKSTLGGAIRTGLFEAAQEGVEEGVTEYSGRAAAQEYDPRIDPTKGVAGAAALGAALGFIPGAGIGAIETRQGLAAEAARKEIEAQQAAQTAAETAASIVPNAEAIQAQAQAAEAAPNLPFGVITPDQQAEAAQQAAAQQVAAQQLEPDETAAIDATRELPLEKKKGETPETKLLRLDAEINLGIELKNGQPKELVPRALKNKIDARNKLVETLGAENVERIRAGREQPSAGIDTAAAESGAVSAARELATAPGGAETLASDGMVPAGEPAPAAVVAEEAQPAALDAIDIRAEQLYNQYAQEQLAAGVPSVLPWSETSEVTKQEFVNQALSEDEARTFESEIQAIDAAEAKIKEKPSVPETTETKQAKPQKEEKPFTPSKRVIELEEKKAEPAAAELSTKEGKAFAAAKVDTRAAPPKNIDEAISHAGAETAFDEFDAALDNLKTTYADQIKAENAANQAKYEENQKLGIESAKPEDVTVYDILGRMTQSERETAISKAIDESKLKPRQLKKKQTRDAFVASLSEEQKKAVEAKRKETLEAEVKGVSKLGKKSLTSIREARKKASAEAATTVAAPKVGKAQPVTKTTVAKAKEEQLNVMDRQTVEELKTGDSTRILNSIKKGYTDPATKLFASQIEKVLSQLGIKPNIVIGKVEGNRPGMYDPATETITIDPSAPRETMLDVVVLHEYAHFITDRAVDNPQNLTPIQRIALDNLSKLHEHVKKKLGKKYEIDTIKEFLAQSFSNSEFVAAMAEVPPLSKVLQVKNALREFATRVMQLLGIKSDSAASQVLENIQTMITGPFAYGVREGQQGPTKIGAKTPGRAEGVSFMEAPKEPKKAGEFAGKSTEEFISGQKLPEKPKGFFGSIKSWFTGGLSGRAKELARQYQNEQYPVKDFQRQLDRSGLLVLDDEAKANNIYDSISLAAGNFRNLDNTYVNPVINQINEMLVNIAKETGQSIDTVLQRLSAYGTVMHESEVRAVKYLRKVPLRSDINNINWYGTAISPDTARSRIFAELTSKTELKDNAAKLGVTPKTLAQEYRKLLDKIVADKNNLDPGENGKKVPEFDISHGNYSVLAGLEPADVQKHLAYFDQNKAEKKMMDDVLAKLRQLSEVTIMLNKQANYWSPQVDNLVDFYGYKNYVTYKGKPVEDKDADLFYGGEQALGRELQQKEYTQEGRYTLPDNPILTMMADAAVAASRSGRKDVTKNLYNLVNTGLIDGKIQTISFQDRYNIKSDPKLLSLMNNQNVFLYYMPEGEVAVISIKNDRLRNAIRKTYQTGSGLIDKLNTFTSYMGQTHTRYNVAFAPKNFIRDMLANAFNIAVDMTPGAAANYVGSIANYIMSNGLYKSGAVAKAFYEGGADPSKNPRLKELLAKDKSGHVKDLIDYLQNGGDIAYVSSFTAKGQFRDLLGEANKSTTLKSFDKVTKFFDVYMASFEFTSRAAAFKMRKAEEVGKLMKKGMSRADAEQAANKPAAAFAKGLANFEERGLKANQMGAWFMFFSASATGAVRVTESLAPAISSVFGGYQAAADRAWAELPTELKNKGNRAEFDKKFIEQAQRGKNTTAVLLGFGVAMYYLAYAGAGEDDFGRNRVATDDMSRWMRDARFFIGDGVNDIITIPWGFGMGAFAALGAQIASLGNSDTKFTEVLANSVPILMDSFLPLPVSRGSIIEKPSEFIIDSVAPAPLKPLIEFAMNYNSLGQEIYNNRQGPNGSVYTGADNVPKMFKDLSISLYRATGFEFGPNEMYFFASAYIDALAKAGAAGWNMFTIGAGSDRSMTERLKQDSLILSGFIGTRADYDARMWNKIEKDLERRKDRLKELEQSDTEMYYEHLADNPLDEFLVEQYKGDANGELKNLRSEAKAIRRSTDYDFSTKRDLLEANRVQQSLLKMQLVDMYKAMGYEF
jgi:Large polyvalent protein associated domain 38